MITLTILTKNEEKNIKNCISSFKPASKISQILVIDDYSQDQTRKIAQSLGAKVVKRELGGDFSKQHNFAVQKAKNDWILSIDADERATPSLLKFLKNVNLDSGTKAFSFYREDIFLGKKLKHGENATNKFTRLFHKKYGKFHRPVHEVWLCSEPIQSTNVVILHHSHRDITGFLESINFYTTLRANYLYKNKKLTNLFEIIFYPLTKFLYNYILLLGFLDGTEGIIMALGMSFHSFLVRSKLWHLHQKK
jgi:glycosyltransferase involved in cell wall biosynthesis